MKKAQTRVLMGSRDSGRELTVLGLVVVAVLFAVGCEGGFRDLSMDDRVPELGLRSLETEEGLRSFLVQAAYDSITARMVMKQLGEEPVDESDFADGSDTDTDTDSDSDSDSDGDSGGGFSPPDPTSSDEFTQTNTQEVDVDEADIVKTDGRYLYILRHGELVIVDALDHEHLQVLSNVWFGGATLAAMYREHLLVVFSRPASFQLSPELSYYPAGSEDYVDQPSAGFSRVTFIDVSKRTAPRVIRTVDYTANYVSSRLVDDTLRVVLTSPLTALQRSLGDSSNDSSAQLFALREAHVEAIEATPLEEILPRKHDAITLRPGIPADIEVGTVSLPVDTFAPEVPAGISVTTIATFDLNKPTERGRDISVIADPGLVYATADHLYLTSSSWYASTALLTGVWSEIVTGIHRFDISGGSLRAVYEGSGGVGGTLIDQFCLDEHDGFLRVASTSGTGEGQSSRVDVMEMVRRQLSVVGSTGELGHGERLFSARFEGGRGFLLTAVEEFVEENPSFCDPLFTMDLSNPRDPAVIGLWEGPGYSTYMHPVGRHGLLAIGIEDNQTVVSLYDLSVLSAPRLVERSTMPMGGSTAALEDHRAFTYSSERELLALPLTADQNGDSGVALFHVMPSGLGEPSVMRMGGQESADVERTLFIGDILYGVSNCRVTNALVSDPETPVESIALYDGDYCD